MRKLIYFLQFVPLWLFLTVARVLPIRLRSAIAGSITKALLAVSPRLRKPADQNLSLIMKDALADERREISAGMARNIGRTLAEILFNKDYAKAARQFEVTGPGLQVLEAQRDKGEGAVIVSGHYGQWEAIRHTLYARGMETGAIYRPTTNPFYEPYFLNAIKLGGEPIVPRGASGVRDMVKALRQGRFMAILIDQRQNDGVWMDFMGEPALVAQAAAELALRRGIPLVPVFGTRLPDGFDVLVEVEEPIEATDAEQMMDQVNKRLEDRIRAKPDQWFWLHDRWRGRSPGE